MKPRAFLIPILATLFLATTAFGAAIPIEDVYVHYKFDEATGTSFADSSLNTNTLNFYRPSLYSELPTVEVSEIVDSGQFGYAIPIGQQTILGVNNQVMIDVPTATHLPEAGDSFAISFWLSTSDWGATYGLLNSYNYQGLEFSIGMHSASTIDGLLVWSDDADEATGNGVYAVNCGTNGLNLTANTLNHFVVQFEGDAGVTNVYVNGASATDAGGDSNAYWGNEHEGITIGGRVLDARPYTTPNQNSMMDDYAIYDGVLTSTQVSNIMTSGAGSVTSGCVLHYALDDTSGSTVTDSSSYANNGTLISNTDTTMTQTNASLDSRARPTGGANAYTGGAIEFASGFAQHGEMTNVDSMPGVSGEAGVTVGDSFTTCFWMKMDENLAGLYGWDTTGVVTSWSNDTLGLSIGIDPSYDGAMIVRRTTGDYTSSANQSVYGVYLGQGKEDTANPGEYFGLNLDPTVYHHFAVTVDEDGVITGMYVDGVYAESHYSNGWGVTDEEMGSVGCRIKNGGYDGAFGGYLDDLGVVKGELSESLIQLAMNQGVAALYEGEDYIPGDANKDGFVDGSDATILANYWQYGVGMTNPDATWEMGDFNGDFVVDGSDATLLASHWQEGTPPSSAVPEPSTLMLILLAGVSFIVLRLKK